MAETFDVCSAFPFTRLSARPAVSTPDGSPIVRAREVTERPLRIFTISNENAPRQILMRLKDLWRVRTHGPSQAMDFTPPDETLIQVRFRAGTFQYAVKSATHASFSVELEEVR